MRSAIVLAALLFGASACGAPDAAGPENNYSSADLENYAAALGDLGAQCGIPDLAYHISPGLKPTLVIDEPRTLGILDDPESNEIGLAPGSERERRVKRAWSCVSQQAGKHDLQIEWPVKEFAD
jgi:hypothetical protein